MFIGNIFVQWRVVLPKKLPHPDDDPEAAVAMGKRIEALVVAIGSRAEAAAVAGVSVQQLGRLIAGQIENPSAVTLGRLARRAKQSLDWVVLGRERTQGEELHETVRYAGRTKRRVLTADAIGKALERAMGVQELPEAIDNAIGDLADTIVDAAGGDEARRLELIERVTGLLLLAH